MRLNEVMKAICARCHKELGQCLCVAGTKDDMGKCPWDKLPWTHMESVMRVLMHGAAEHGGDWDNWKRVPDAPRRYWAALMRHALAWLKGEKLDPKSGESHLSHCICNCLFLMGLE